MSTITFSFRGLEILIQCSPKERFETIIPKFCEKTKTERNNMRFLFNGKILDEQISEDKVPINEENKKCIIVNDISSNNPVDVFIKSKDIICPTCKGCASISIDDDYKISIIN